MIAHLLCSLLVAVGLSHAPTDLFKYNFFLESAECCVSALCTEFCYVISCAPPEPFWCRLALHFSPLATLYTCPCPHFLFLPPEFCKSGLELSSVLCEDSYEWNSLVPPVEFPLRRLSCCGAYRTAATFCPDNWSVYLILNVMVFGKPAWLQRVVQKCH